MGREASCTCRWQGKDFEVKALLESSELILRGGIKRKIPFAALTQVAVQGESLSFLIEDEPMWLLLGSETAAKWVRSIVSPPSLSKKLGVNSETVVGTFGNIEEPALLAAIAEGKQTPDQRPDLIIAAADVPEELESLLEHLKSDERSSIPIWVVYRKGKGQPLSESLIRERFRADGFVDTKVASISPTLTSQRFIRRSG